MFDDRKENIVLILVISAIFFNIYCFFPDPWRIHRIRFIDWWWIPAFGLPITAIGLMLYWKLKGLGLRLFVMLLSIISIIFSSLLWLAIYFISHLNP